MEGDRLRGDCSKSRKAGDGQEVSGVLCLLREGTEMPCSQSTSVQSVVAVAAVVGDVHCGTGCS